MSISFISILWLLQRYIVCNYLFWLSATIAISSIKLKISLVFQKWNRNLFSPYGNMVFRLSSGVKRYIAHLTLSREKTYSEIYTQTDTSLTNNSYFLPHAKITTKPCFLIKYYWYYFLIWYSVLCFIHLVYKIKSFFLSIIPTFINKFGRKGILTLCFTILLLFITPLYLTDHNIIYYRHHRQL